MRRDGRSSAKYDQRLDRTTDIIEAYRSLAQSDGLHLLSSLEPPGVLSAKMLAALRDDGLVAGSS